MGAQVALQPLYDAGGLLRRGVGQHDDEFLAAVAADGVLRAQAAARDVGQVLERRVSGQVAQRVVEALEIVHVQQRDAHARAGALGAARLAVDGAGQSLAVEHAGQQVVRDQLGHLIQLGAQALYLGLGAVGAVAQLGQLLGHALGVHRKGACGLDGILHHGGHVGQAVGALQRLRAGFELGLVLAGAGGRLCQPLQEGGQRFAHQGLRTHGLLARLGLLDNDVLQPRLQVLQPALRQGRLGGLHQRLHLLAQPRVVGADGVDVLEHLPQQPQQPLPHAQLLLHAEREPVGVVRQHAAQRRGVLLLQPQVAHQLLAHFAQAGVVGGHQRQAHVDQARSLFGQVGR